ncbi:RBBP9/YdeN family alpha/beta hydrolase [Cupriavidus oxalaticus]|uniref:RBBP9/YdeN family alpha/beta hydrolase n=1 Tax=Cupriavidus oxalaticus TaxID=96344 RepID=UPI00316C1335
MTASTVLIVPGLRDQVEEHWQTLLAASLPGARTVPPMGRGDLDCSRRVAAIEEAVASIAGPIIMVAHSGGCVMMAHWALVTAHAARIKGVLLATPPDFERPMPEGYPPLSAIEAGGWLPVPRQRLPFPSLVATSQNDPLGELPRVLELARAWGSEVFDLGKVGHLNPASGYGPWPMAEQLIARLEAGSTVQ